MKTAEYADDRQLSCRAFTLIELLVVVMIVAILAALMLPVLSSSRDSARALRCQTNLRQIGVALHAYIADNDGEYPPNNANSHWAELHPQWGGSPYTQWYLTAYGGGEKVYLSYPVSHLHYSGEGQYSDAGPWYCPASGYVPASADFSYGFNRYLGGDDRTAANVAGGTTHWKPWWSKPSASSRSGQLIFCIDKDWKDHGWCGSVIDESMWPLKSSDAKTYVIPTGEQYIALRHHGKANALFVDGSARPMTFEDLQGAGFKYINPDYSSNPMD